MAEILVAYETGEGQTRNIAEHLATALREHGHDTTTVDLRAAPDDVDPSAHDAVVVGGSIHVGSHGSRLVRFVEHNVAALTSRPSAFFQVSLSAASEDPERRAEADSYLAALLAQTGWAPDSVASFAGALRYSEYGFLKRAMMRRIAKDATGDTDTSRDYEYTDWAAVERFAAEVAGLVDSGTVPPAGSRTTPSEGTTGPEYEVGR